MPSCASPLLKEMLVLHYFTMYILFIAQALLATDNPFFSYSPASSDGDPVSIQGNVVYDKLKKNIYMTFQGPNFSNVIKTLLDQTGGRDTPYNPSAGNSSNPSYINQNTKQILDTNIQDRVFNLQASKATHHQLNNNVLNTSSVGYPKNKWHTFNAITPGKSVDKLGHGTSVALPTINKIDAAADAITGYKRGSGIDKKSSVKTSYGILADTFGELLFGNESESNFEMAALRAHNRYRTIHTSPPLRLNQELSREAEAQAKRLAGIGQVIHDKQSALWNGSKGENVARFCGDLGLTASGAVKRWYDEVCSYNWNSKEVLPNTRRFRELISKENNELGIGRAKGFINGQTCTYIVAYYRPVLLSKEIAQHQKIKKGMFKKGYCQEMINYAGSNKMEQLPRPKPRTITNASYTNHLQKLALAHDESTLHTNGTSKGNNNFKKLHQMMSKNNGGTNIKTIKPYVIFKNTTKDAANETGKESHLGGDTKVEMLLNKTHTSLKPLEEPSIYHNKSDEHSRVYTPRVKTPVSSHEKSLGLHISAAGSDSELLDKEPIEHWSNSEAAPITLQGSHHDTPPEKLLFTTQSEKASHYGNAITQTQPVEPEAMPNVLDYSTGQLQDYQQAQSPTEAKNRHLVDMDSIDDVNDVKDVALSDTFTDKNPSQTHYKGEDELPPKLYQQMQDSFNRVDDEGIDEYQPQDDFTITMEPDQGRQFSDDSDYESHDEDSLFNSYNGMKYRNGHIKWRDLLDT